MKKIGLCLALVLLCHALTLGFVGCGKTVKDDYGYERPKDAWLTECLLLPVCPINTDSGATPGEGEIAMSELFGSSGESGIVSEQVLAQNGQLTEDGKGFLVYLICATGAGIPALDQQLQSHYLNLTYCNGSKVLCGDTLTKGLSVSSVGDLQASGVRDENGELFVEVNFTENGIIDSKIKDGAACGAILIPVDLGGKPESGALGVRFQLKPDGEVPHDTTHVQYQHTFALGKGTAGVTAEIKDFSVMYMTKKHYDAGEDVHSLNYLSQEPIFENAGEECFAILTFSVVATADNDGSGSLKLVTQIRGENTVDMRIDAAPTGKVEMISTVDGTAVCASFGIPQVAGEEKEVTMVLQLRPLKDCKTELNAIVVGNAGTKLSGAGYDYNIVDTTKRF